MGRGVLVEKVCYASCRGLQFVVQFLDLYMMNRFEDGWKKRQTQTHGRDIFQNISLAVYLGFVGNSLDT